MITLMLCDDHRETADCLRLEELESSLQAARRVVYALVRGATHPSLKRIPYHNLWRNNSGKLRDLYLANLRDYAETLHRAWQYKVAQQNVVFEGILRNRVRPVEDTLDAVRFIRRELRVYNTCKELRWHPMVYASHACHLKQLSPDYYAVNLPRLGLPDPERHFPLTNIFPTIHKEIWEK